MKLRKIEYIVGGAIDHLAPLLSLSGFIIDWYGAKKYKSQLEVKAKAKAD